MKKVLIVLGILTALALIIGGVIAAKGVAVYNAIVVEQESVNKAWADVQSVYQRRNDLIPNLAATVEGYAKHESSTLTMVAEARSQMGGVVKLDENMLRDPAAMARFQQAQSTIAGGLQRLMMVTEQYPDLKANVQFQDLMVQLEGTENRISVERRRYNEAVMKFNAMIRQFPTNLIAGFLQVKPFVPFAAEDKAQKAPVLKFDTGRPAPQPAKAP